MRATIGAIDGGVGFFADPFGTGVDDGLFGVGICLEGGVGKADELADGIELLGDEVFGLGVLAEGEPGGGEDGDGFRAGGDEALNDADIGVGGDVDDEAGKEESFTGDEVDDFDGGFSGGGDFNAVVRLGGVEGGEFFGAESGLGAEGFGDDLNVLALAGDEFGILEDEAGEAFDLGREVGG